ncbi:MAG: hypothetical protein BJ554DRAFT_3980, partial [Olpidium bornovanus]
TWSACSPGKCNTRLNKERYGSGRKEEDARGRRLMHKSIPVIVHRTWSPAGPEPRALTGRNV